MKVPHTTGLPLGFAANGVRAGLKRSGALDLALVYSVRPAQAACLFTSNAVQAAPIKICKEHLRRSPRCQALIVNSGNANCFTGAAGRRDAAAMAAYAGAALGIRKESVLVASTGVISRRLPLEKIRQAVPDLAAGLSVGGLSKVSRAIMTTDTFAKEAGVCVRIAGTPVILSGIAKGAGMIAPDLATMLAFVFTDAAIALPALRRALKGAADRSFNCITIDGCMSTNDTLAVLANGAAGNPLIASGRSYLQFADALGYVCAELARMIVRDAEGATKFITINVSGAESPLAARRVALSIANSALFKTAIFAESRNFFGRVVAAAGASGVRLKEEQLKIKVSPLEKKEIVLDLSVGRGRGGATIYTSDLTYDYVKINAEYN